MPCRADRILATALVFGLAAAPLAAQEAVAEAAVSEALEALDERPLSGLGFMLTPREREALEQARLGRAIEQEPGLPTDAATEEPVEAAVPPSPSENKYLGGLIYVEGGGWAAWVNDRRLRTDRNPGEEDGDDVIVTGVARDGVELSWDDPQSGVTQRILRPNQTFRPEEGDYREGYWPSPEATPAPPPPTAPATAP